ncbi:hypothetical protein [Streptomyces sp. NBC_00385]|uniref:hypothetical protein n=1 Tax=Streptomyces sp. NBC_00385 TaxID=2975733 RepID=UPI002DD7AA85|nr:hypothetical protein [Streptomyces sp. NBC_00385]WRZ06769.1 hypothetical protein OG959_27270 [Streptomyces sp. NBC_00385]
MSRQGRAGALRSQVELRSVLSLVLDQVDPGTSGLAYRLVGTGAALAQGVPLPVGDVDILVRRREDVDGFAAGLSGFPCLDAPAWLPDARQYFARFRVDGTEVEISTVEHPADTDTFECAGSGPWTHWVHAGIGRHVVPVVGLELRLVSELVRNRPDRIGPLIAHMRVHGADLPLVRRAMSERKVEPKMTARVLEQLRKQ